MDMLEHGKAEPDNPFVLLPGCRQAGRVKDAEHLVYAAGEQLILSRKCV
jgi:hypothetical protein